MHILAYLSGFAEVTQDTSWWGILPWWSKLVLLLGLVRVVVWISKKAPPKYKETPAEQRAQQAQQKPRINVGQKPQAPITAAVPSPAPPQVDASIDPANDRLAKLKSYMDRGLISESEYEAKKAEILASL